jgi:ubiquinone/menaquinone biosynthesis C-methylase UbiE
MRGRTALTIPKRVSYNEVADPYERYHVRKGIALLARDLVLAMELPYVATILDVGTGTGEAALIALAHSARSVIVGIDPSRPMLHLAAKKGLRLLVASETPGLPFSAGRFDAVMATLVISHLKNYQEALVDMVRVLKPRGRLGVTAWAARSSRHARAADVWRRAAESFVGGEALRSASDYVAPWENWFTEPEHIASALMGAGLKEVRIERRDYRVSITAAEYLSRMESSGWGRCMRGTLDQSRWVDFQRTVADRFTSSLPRRFTITPSAHLAIAIK